MAETLAPGKSIARGQFAAIPACMVGLFDANQLRISAGRAEPRQVGQIIGIAEPDRVQVGPPFLKLPE